jgi:endonuclease/exonuclease/phosphatase family metal-dependent hydrolase
MIQPAGTAPRSAWPRRLFAVLIAGAMAGLLISAIPRQAEALSATRLFVQFNLCGNVCTQGRATVADDLVRAVRSRHTQPAAMFLQEVCRSQYDRLTSQLTAYTGHFEPTIPNRCDDRSDFGIAVLLRSHDVDYLGSWLLPNPAAGEPRAITCLRTAAIPGTTRPLVACSTHIDVEAGNPQPQIEAVAARAREFGRNHRVIIGGDFNVRPTHAYLDPMYASVYRHGTGIFDEADADVGRHRRTGGGPATTYHAFTSCNGSPCPKEFAVRRKFDYIFMSRPGFTQISAAPGNASHSDHRPLWATAKIT